MHALAMCHVLKNLGSGIPAGMAAALQMQSIAGHPPVDSMMPSYLLARDSYGYQVVLCSPSTWPAQWADIMSAGVGDYSINGITGNGLRAIPRVAGRVFADLVTRVTVNDDIIIMAAGPFAGAANHLAKRLVTNGNRVRRVVKCSAPKSFTDAEWDAIEALDIDNISVWHNMDQTIDCPPSLLSSPRFGAGLGGFLFAGGRSILPPLFRYGRYYDASRYENPSQPDPWPNAAATLNASNPQAWYDGLEEAYTYIEGSTTAYINEIWLTFRREYHRYLNEWRAILNGNYGFALRDLQNLGI